MKHLALLRGINVGKRRLSMEALREVASGLGWHDVRTHLASGNLIFTPGEGEAGLTEPMLGSALRGALLEASGLDIPVLVRSAAQWQTITDACPWPAEEGKLVHVQVADEPLSADQHTRLDALLAEIAAAGGRDEVVARELPGVPGQTLYLHTPDGFSSSRLFTHLPQALGKAHQGTARNWTTTQKLADLLGV